METLSEAKFKQNYARHLQHLKLKGLQPTRARGASAKVTANQPPRLSRGRHRAGG